MITASFRANCGAPGTSRTAICIIYAFDRFAKEVSDSFFRHRTGIKSDPVTLEPCPCGRARRSCGMQNCELRCHDRVKAVIWPDLCLSSYVPLRSPRRIHHDLE